MKRRYVRSDSKDKKSMCYKLTAQEAGGRKDGRIPWGVRIFEAETTARTMVYSKKEFYESYKLNSG